MADDEATPGRRRLPGKDGIDPVLMAAWLYYEEGLKQDEVAHHLGLSRATVFNLLQKARDEGVVTITLDPSRMQVIKLAAALKRNAGLQECFVVPSDGAGEPLFDRIGRLGARLLEQRLDAHDVIGVAWGRTVLALSKSLTTKRMPNVSIAQITGSSIATYDFSPELCTSNIALRLGARCINLHAPGIVSTAQMKTLLMREPIIEQHFNLLRSCTKTLFGVTQLGSETLLKDSGFMSEQILSDYQAKGAVGFASGYFFDENGQPVTTDLDARHIGMARQDFLRVPERICVGGGREKVIAIRAMLKGGFANVLVTDEETAQSLL
jgi:DNA-binding transcriptional regulator LsrR (DeoR family)